MQGCAKTAVLCGALFLVGADMGVADAGRGDPTVVVLPVDGARRISRTVRELIEEDHRLASARKYKRYARRMGVEAGENTGEVCRRLRCDGVVVSRLKRRSRGYVLDIRIYGTDQSTPVEKISVRLKRRTIPRRLRRELQNRMTDALGTLGVSRREARAAFKDDFEDDFADETPRRRSKQKFQEDFSDDEDEETSRFSRKRFKESFDDEEDKGEMRRRKEFRDGTDSENPLSVRNRDGDSDEPVETMGQDQKFGIRLGILIDEVTAFSGGVHYRFNEFEQFPQLSIEPAVEVFFGNATVADQATSFQGGRLLGQVKYSFPVGPKGLEVFPLAGAEVFHLRSSQNNETVSTTKLGAHVGGGLQYNEFGLQGHLGAGDVFDYTITGLYRF